ncbi:MAG: chemotaxis-specific protein-glutamate methyltransferase CheB [Methanomassiliicoccales archaeon]|nr:chemotaxis-specific protein-glutamate methyltransferase CheB [Methanomassiliicoccales archaeon]
MIKVVIVEDSPVAQEYLIYLFTSDPSVKVVGVARNGLEAIEVVRRERPDVITMDIHMPIMDGFEATRRIMETVPTPIVIVSASSGTKEVGATFKAIEAGALAFVRRPPGSDHQEFDAAAKELVQTVKLMSEVKVVKRLPRRITAEKSPPVPLAPLSRDLPEIELIAIGASTGGPLALQEILSILPQDLPVPVLIVQHIASGFKEGLVSWLTETSHFPLSIASHGEYLIPGHGYIAPDNHHMGVGDGMRIVLSNHAPENGMRPAVAYLFRTVAEVMDSHAAGVLLTGMGKDGAEELKTMKDRGSVTIAQDEASSVVFGMPGEAIRLDAAVYILPPEGIGKILATLVKGSKGVPP